MTSTYRPEPLLWLSDARGVYIPRDFATSFSNRAKDVSGVTDEQWAILEAGPDHEWYWETWNEVEQSARIRDDQRNVTYGVYQNGDCWLIPDGMEWSEEQDFFVWPSNDDEED